MKKNNENLDQYLSIESVSKLLEISRGTVYNLIKKGKLKKCKITPDITRLKASEVQAFLDARST